MLKLVQKYPKSAWFVIGCIIFMPFLGQSHLFDWDEVNFAESAREMIVSGDYLGVQINFKPFWEKPPLFIWLQAASFLFFKIFTENAWVSMEFAARFPNAIIGAISLVIFYQIGKKEHGERFGHWWAFSYLAAFTPHLYASTGIIDPLFNLFIFLGIYHFYLHLLHGTFIKNTYDSILDPKKLNSYLYRPLSLNELKVDAELAQRRIPLIFGNQELFQNMVDYMMGDNSVLDIRSRQIDIKEIDKEKIKSASLFYKSINMLLPLLIILALAFVMNWIRNRKYARKL